MYGDIVDNTQFMHWAFFNPLKLNKPIIVKCNAAFSHINYFLKKRKIDNMRCKQNTQTKKLQYKIAKDKTQK